MDFARRLFSGPALGERAGGRDNNFNLIRLIAALGVLVSHAWPLTLGGAAREPLEHAVGMSLGAVSVAVFFGISGFLIARSFDRGSSLARFAKARALRLFPALVLALIVTTLVCGAALTTAPAGDFWAAAPVYILRNTLLFPLQYALPGVFEGNPGGTAVNGSLWTLKHEVACYGGVVVLGLAGGLRAGRRTALAMAGFLAFYLAMQIAPIHQQVYAFVRVALPFAVGTCLYVARDRVPLSPAIGLGLAGAVLAVRLTPSLAPATPALFAAALVYWTFLAAYLPRGRILLFNRLGDYSYGAYVYAFPIQQAAVAVLGPMSPLENILLALPVTMICAIFSWHMLEKPALALVRRPRPAMEAGRAAGG